MPEGHLRRPGKGGADCGLTPKQRRFVEEFLVDMNATQAAIRAGYSEKTARSVGFENLTKPDIAAALSAARKKQSERVEITADMVMQRYWALATADPNELMQVRRNCCRCCFGENFAYQWRDLEEFREATRLAIAAAGEDGEPVLPSAAGGFGFDPKLPPHPKCPHCDGEGRVDIHLSDTRKLTGGAAMLFAGVKTTQNGIEIKTHDQLAALNAVARHLGLFNDKVTIKKPIEDLTDDELDARIAALTAAKDGASGADAGS